MEEGWEKGGALIDGGKECSEEKVVLDRVGEVCREGM